MVRQRERIRAGLDLGVGKGDCHFDEPATARRTASGSSNVAIKKRLHAKYVRAQGPGTNASPRMANSSP